MQLRGFAYSQWKKTFSFILLSVVLNSLKTDGQRGPGGASRCSGGRDEPPRSLASSVVPQVNRRWVPPSSIKRDAITQHERHDSVFRKVRGILNKLTPDKFHKLSEELLNIGLDTPTILKGVILLIFEKALDEPKYSSMYAQLCRKLCEEAPNFEAHNNSGVSTNRLEQTFRHLLLSKCRDEFENRSRATEAFDKNDVPLTAEEEEQRTFAKRKMLGNIKFIGELGKLDMLHESILHKCIIQLLEKKKKCRGGVKDVAEDLECLCQIMRTVGRSLDTDKARPLMAQYFDRMETFANSPELPSRIRFMMQDVIELRGNKWVPRQVLNEHGPKTIQQIREDAAKDYGFFIPPASSNRNPGGLGGPIGLRGHVSNARNRGGMDDVFSAVPLGVFNLGTGPGVISTDHFNGFSGMARSGRNNMSNSRGNASMQNLAYSGRQQQQHNQAGAKELPPRFKKSPFTGNFDEISLRPAQNSMMMKPKTPVILPKSTIPPNQGLSGQDNYHAPPALPIPKPAGIINPVIQKETSILIKQASVEKSKPNKKEQTLTKEEAHKKTEDLLLSFLTQMDNDKFVSAMKELKIPKKFMVDIVTLMMSKSLGKSDVDRDNISKVLVAFKKEGLMTTSNFHEGFKSLLQQIVNMEAEIPRVKSFVAGFAARAVVDDLITLAEIADLLENGLHYPLFLLCLQQLHKLQGKEWLGKVFTDSKVKLQNMLPELDRSKEKLMDVLEDRGLSFLFPLLRIQADLWRQIQSDPNPAAFYKWVKENVDQAQQTTPGFVNVLVTCLIRYITSESTLGAGCDSTVLPDKGLQEKEKDLLEKFRPVFQAFLHAHVSLQLVALYALQVHACNNGFPKGMLLRWFVMFYGMEIIEEEAFLKWKEDISDEYPGKGKALFQVNQWLIWLEEEEEEEEDEDGGSDDGDN